MSHHFRPAKREAVQLIFGLGGASGSGKTYSLFQVATGLAYPEARNAEELNAIIEREGRNRIACIDTERGRALHYAPPPGEKPDPWRREGAWFPFDHCAMEPPFSPDKYSELVEAADDAGYRVIIVDSFSHEWAGEGGVLEWHEAEQYDKAKRRANYGNSGNDREPQWKDLEAVKMTAWIKPKMAHKKMIGRITTLRAHLLVGLRAEQKVKMVEEEQGNGRKKTVIISAADLPPAERWSPVCEKAFPFELTISFVLGPEAPGVPHILKLQDQHRPFVDLNRPLSMETGRALAAWASGAKAAGEAPKPSTRDERDQPRGQGVTEAEDPDLRRELDDYKRGLQGARVKDLPSLQRYQERSADWLEWMKNNAPKLHAEALAANAARYSELSSASDQGRSSSANESEGAQGGSDSLFPDEES